MQNLVHSSSVWSLNAKLPGEAGIEKQSSHENEPPRVESS
jgi:hypothetical protein